MSLRDADANAFLRACPGAGKTYEVITRFLHRTVEERRKGVALLSFSNCAVDEAAERCGKLPEALKPPNFVGTFDAFIHRFITTPHLAAKGTQPRYVDEWGQIPDTEIRLRGNDRRVPFQLEWFDFEPDGTCSFDPERSHAGLRKAHRNLAERKSGALCRAASYKRKSLIRKGIVSCSAARVIAHGLLSIEATRSTVTERLAARFAEIIVDEMQDCSADELEILQMCRDANIDLVLVADLDQSIYEFRNAVPEAVRAFSDTLTTLPGLMTNRRSTPEISSINNSLRHNHHAESANRTSLETPVYVIVGEDPTRIRGTFLQLLRQHSVSHNDSIVLGHRQADATRISGNGTSNFSTNDSVASLAIAITEAADELAMPRDRQKPQTKIEAGLLKFLALSDVSRSIEDILEQASIDRRWFKRLTASTKTTMRPHIGSGRSVFAQQLKKSLNAVSWPAGHAINSSAIRTPTERSWRAVVTLPEPVEDAIRSSTIHGVKGQEFDAVLLAIPESLRRDGDNLTVLDHWEQDCPTEARRVLYVGASRASNLLAVTVASLHRDQMMRILEQDGVVYSEVAVLDS